jgi:putative copper export protein
VSDAQALFCESLTKAALSLALQCVVGTAAVYWLARSCGVIEAPGASTIERRLRTAAVWSSVVLLAATAARVFAHTAAVFGHIDAESVRTIAVQSRWGHAWRLQTGAALLACVTAAVVRRAGRVGWPLYSIAALLCCASVPLLGHGAGALSRSVLHAVHVAAGGVWIGSLFLFVILISARGGRDLEGMRGTIAAFSSVALTSAAVLVATGAVASVLYVQRISHLWDSVYGRVLVGKLLLVGVVAACGRQNWHHSRRGEMPRLRVMLMEVAAAVLVVLVTGVLTEIEHP